MPNDKDQIKSAILAVGGLLLEHLAEIGAQKASEPRQPPPDQARRASDPQQPKKPLDPYAFLRVMPSASKEEIQEVYRVLSRMNHPDKAKNAEEQEVMAKRQQRINAAYEAIKRERQERGEWK